MEKTYFIDEDIFGDLALDMSDVIALTMQTGRYQSLPEGVEEPAEEVEDLFDYASVKLAEKEQVLRRRKADAKAKAYQRKGHLPLCERKKLHRENPEAEYTFSPKEEKQFRRGWRMYNARPQEPKATVRQKVRQDAVKLVFEDELTAIDLTWFDPDSYAEEFAQELRNVGCYHPAYHTKVEVWRNGMPIQLEVGC